MSLRVLMWPARREQELNPYAPTLAANLEALGVEVVEFSARHAVVGRHDVVHVHWPDGFLDGRRPLLLAAAHAVLRLAVLAIARRRGARLVWTVHNLGAHEGRHAGVGRWFMNRFTAMVDGWFSLTAAAVPAVTAAHPALAGRPSFVVRHGLYVDAYSDVPADEAHRSLDLEGAGPVLLCFGQVRRYKDVPRLIAAFLASGAPGTLVVAGAVADDALADEVRAAAGDRRVRLHLGAVADADVPRFVRAADLVVLPQPSALNSGAAFLALGYDRPLLLASGPAADELAALAGSAWVRTFEPPIDAAALDAAVRWATGDRPEPPDLSELAWPRLAAATRDAYAAVVGG